MVHGSDLSFLFSRQRQGGDTVAYHLRTSDKELALGIACFCAESTLQAGIATAGMFGTPGTESMRERLTSIEALQNTLSTTNSSAAQLER
jgi:hypothetical protein